MFKLIAFSLFIFLNVANAQDHLGSKSGSHNLVEVLEEVYNSSLDISQYFDVSIVESISNVGSECKDVKNEMIYNRIVRSFDILSKTYPDDEFPIESAKQELNEILNKSSYVVCPLELDEAYSDIVYKNLYISKNNKVSFLIESSNY